MGHSSPVPADDQRGHRIAGTAVVFALIVLVVGGAGLSVAMHFLIRPFPPARPEVVSETDGAATTASDDRQTVPPATKAFTSPPDAGRQAHGRAAFPAQTVNPQHPVLSATPRDGRGEVPAASGQPPEKSTPSGFDVSTLSPIEVEADGASRDAWQRSVGIGGQAYDRAVCLRPAENRGTTQIAFDIDGRFARLRGVAGIADSSSPGTAGAAQDRPQAVFRVYGDGNLLWESGPLAGRGEHRAFECSVAGVDVLTFVAESQSPANISDLAWGDLKLFPNTETSAPETPNPPKTP